MLDAAVENDSNIASTSARHAASVAITPSVQVPPVPFKPRIDCQCLAARCSARTMAQPSDALGEALLVLARILPARQCICARANTAEGDRHPRQHQRIVRRRRSSSDFYRGRTYRVLIIPVACMVACKVAFTLALPERLEQFIGGILLAASAGTLYLSLCFLLCTVSTTRTLGAMLLRRSNLFSWRRDHLRFFLEVCSWMASVWFSYTVSHREMVSIGLGAVWALTIALCSDFAAAYARVVESRLQQQQSSRASESVAWLKVGLSYICVGYVLTASWRLLSAFLSGEVADLQSLEELVVTYLLVTLVGVSLIVASELLLLYEPTRNAGIALQSRIVDARYNWENKTWRSLIESTAVLASTIFAYQTSQDMTLSLQTGTLTGVAVIIAGDSISSNVLLFSRRQDELPADHWVKLLPLGVMMLYFLFQVGVTMVNLVLLPTYTGLYLVWSVFICAVALTIVALNDSSFVSWKVAAFGMRFGVRICVASVTAVAIAVCSGWPAVAFSTYLSWFCAILSKECWYEIEMKENRKAAALRNACQPEDEVCVERPTSVMGYMRVNFSYLYKRVKWTFISIVIVSIVDVCPTIFLLLNHGPHMVTLSQFSACNVVVSTGVGYLTSTISHELRPEVLVQTGFKHFTNKWQLFPLHAMIETTVFVAVFIGTFTTSSTMFSSLTLAALSGIVISVGGHWVRSRLNLTVGTEARVQLTATCAIMFCVFLLAWVSFLCLFSIYHYIDSIEAAFCLASLAGVFFLASSELFLLWEPTREIGHILQSRVTHAKENWQAEPLRSFLEIFTWFAVIIGSFVLYKDLLLAIQLGTFSGIAVTLSGEFYRRKRSLFIPLSPNEDGRSTPKAPTTSDRPRVLPAMLLFAYIGSGTFQWIFENIRSIEVTVLLASTAGFAFLCVGDLLVQYEPTRWAGIILQDRFLRARENWNENPVRSFVELGCFLGVIYGSYAIYGDLLVATQVGTVSGMLVTLIGEQLRSHARVIPVADSVDVSEKAQVLPLPVMSLLGLVGAIAFNIIYTHLRSIEIAFVLATTSGVAFAVLGDVFVIWKPTRKVGLILQDRVLHIQYNWKIHPLRSLLEISMCALAWFASYVFIWHKDLLVAILVGTATGIVACVCDELTTEYLTTYEQKMRMRAAKTSARTNPQTDSAFLALPTELQFHVGYFLTPEDLLVTRATCHKVNNMLRAESARYWLYASIRRKIGGGRRASTNGGSDRSRGQSRSLIYEVITLILPKILGSRDPTDVLTSGIDLNRALKWVYLNADWIRLQGLEAVPDAERGRRLRFVPGDVAFEVFRHIPDKSCLGISAERDDDALITVIDVPVDVYTKIQADPLSFVAAETLSEVDAFSNWHVAIVAFSAMTLIFIGQFSSDVLRKHVFPESFWWPG